MKNTIPFFIAGFLFLYGQLAYAQTAIQLTQYQEVLPLYNPAFSGIENHTDIKLGLRRQWSGVANPPQANYFHFNGSLQAARKKKRKSRYKSPYDIDKMTDMVELPNNGMRISNQGLYRKLVRDSIKVAVRKLDRKARLKLRRQLQPVNSLVLQPKHGFSATLLSDQQGAFSSLSVNGAYAFHIPVSSATMLSLGVSATYNVSDFDSEKATVNDAANDPLYQLYASGEVQNSSYFINPGVSLYSEEFYVSYGLNRVLGEGLGSSRVVGVEGTETQHNFMGAVFINLSENFLLSPSVLFTYKSLSPAAFFASAKVYYNRQFWVGMNYRDQDAFGGALGVLFSDKYRFSYSYDVPVSKLNNSLGSTHEIVFGIMIKKGSSPTPLIF